MRVPSAPIRSATRDSSARCWIAESFLRPRNSRRRFFPQRTLPQISIRLWPRHASHCKQWQPTLLPNEKVAGKMPTPRNLRARPFDLLRVKSSRPANSNTERTNMPEGIELPEAHHGHEEDN